MPFNRACKPSLQYLSLKGLVGISYLRSNQIDCDATPSYHNELLACAFIERSNDWVVI